jgi:D-glycero-alpha-D-manno-heptose-7-phosphate kinase
VIGPYPDVRHEAITLAPDVEAALGERLVTVVFGPHDSSAVHGEVIRLMTTCGGAEHGAARLALRRLSLLAGRAADALGAGDLDTWGRVLVDSTEAQRSLAPGLVGPAHQGAIEVARDSGAIGWKVNGAGGNGGSLTVLASGADQANEIRAALCAVDPTWQLLDLRPSGGREIRIS